MNTRVVTLSEDIRPDKEYVRWLRTRAADECPLLQYELGVAELHDDRVTDKQPALTLLHKAGYAECPKAATALTNRHRLLNMITIRIILTTNRHELSGFVPVCLGVFGSLYEKS